MHRVWKQPPKLTPDWILNVNKNLAKWRKRKSIPCMANNKCKVSEIKKKKKKTNRIAQRGKTRKACKVCISAFPVLFVEDLVFLFQHVMD